MANNNNLIDVNSNVYNENKDNINITSDLDTEGSQNNDKVSNIPSGPIGIVEDNIKYIENKENKKNV